MPSAATSAAGASESDRGAVEFVTLRGGLVLPVAALELLLALEERGCVLRREPDGTLFVGPRALLTAPETAQLQAHRDDVLALVDYCERRP